MRTRTPEFFGGGEPNRKSSHMAEEGRNAMSAYCKAQAQINKIEKENDEERRSLNERIRTYRSLLQETMETQKLTCIELGGGGGEQGEEPVYVRLKQNSQMPSMDHEFVMEVMKQIDYNGLGSVADKQGHDLPRMLTHVFSSEVKQKHSRTSDKTSLSISKTRERGFDRDSQSAVTPAMMQIAKDLMSARGELSTLKQKASTTKRQCLEEQKEVEDTVKTALRKSDPVNMTARVHMMQDGNEWVYYLRCKEKEVTPSIGIRRVVQLVESSIIHALSDLGLGREFSPHFRPNGMFWDSFSKELANQMEQVKANIKRESRLSLDRGAPRRSSKKAGSDAP